MKLLRSLIDSYKENRASFIVWSVLQIVVVLIMVRHLFLGDTYSALICLLTLLLFVIPPIIKRTFRITIPTGLEVLVLLFIFSAEILGEINKFYIQIPYWDLILHTLNGFAAAGIGLSLVLMADRASEHLRLTAGFASLMAFCFSMTVGVVWEFSEYFADNVLGRDSQMDTMVSHIATSELDETRTKQIIRVDDISKTILYDKDGNELAQIDGYLDLGLRDTMEDLLVNMAGAVVFCTFGYFYVKHDKNTFLDNLLIKKRPTKKK